MGDVASKGRTILFVSHNMQSVSDLCTRVAMLKHGVMDRAGNPDEVIDYYLRETSNDSEWYIRKEIEDKEIFIDKAFVTGGPDGKSSHDKSDNSILTIEYTVNRSKVDCVIAAQVVDVLGGIISTIIDIDADERAFRKLQGHYVTRLSLPTSLLNSGSYFVNISISDMKSHRYDYIEKACRFEVLLNSRTSIAVEGRKGGLLFVEKWRTEKILYND